MKRYRLRCLKQFILISGTLFLIGAVNLLLRSSAGNSHLHDSDETDGSTGQRVEGKKGLSAAAAPNFVVKEAESKNETKLILLWSRRGQIYWKDDFTNQLLLSECPEAKCTLSIDQSLVNKAHAVLFHWTELRSGLAVPTVRYNWQRFVFFSFESAGYYPATKGSFDGFFNWTLSYRRDATFSVPYGFMLPKDVAMDQDVDYTLMQRILTKKKKMAAIFVSNCYTNSGRENYIKDLQQYVSVDVYGKCGTKQCDRDDAQLPSACHLQVEQDYFFYLSFENSICKDYATEKFFKFLPLTVIPVVLSRSVAEGVAPNGSFIAVDDFKSPKDLASYLIHLSRNASAYLEYFSWKQKFRAIPWHNWAYHVPEAAQMGYCALCQALHNSTWPDQVLPSLKNWWSDEAKCSRLRV